MPSLTCYRLKSQIGDGVVENFHNVLDYGTLRIAEYGPIDGGGFVAYALVVGNVPHQASWASFLRSGFGDVDIPMANSPAALLVVEVQRGDKILRFAFPFGVAGRHILADDGYQRGYGLRTALNIIYPRGTTADDAARLRSVDSKRRGPTILRSRSQASEASAFENFNVSQLQDVISAATGVPNDPATWGPRVSGGDPVRLDLDITFGDLGDLCLRIEGIHDREDYKDTFGWIDDIQPVTDPDLKLRLESAVIGKLTEDDGRGLSLAPPEIIDWDRVSAFRYHFDRRQGAAQAPVTHPELRMADYLRGLRPDPELTINQLKSRRIMAVDGDAKTVSEWPVWRCLVGEITLNDSTFILDEGEFYNVRSDYIDDLDTYIDGIPEANIDLPTSSPTMPEQTYNETTANSRGFVLLDGSPRTVRIQGRTTAVEICDLLTPQRELIHVKRHLASNNLSHLFAQGFVSAELLQMNTEFRHLAHNRAIENAGDRPGFDFLDTDTFVSRNFAVIYAVIADWHARTPSQALPFFAKVNLRNVIEQLKSRGFQVGFRRIDIR